MKTSKLFTLAIAALALLSCTNEEPPATPEAGRSKLTINIKGQVDAPTGRAGGKPTQTEESTVNNFYLFVFKQDGTNDIAPRKIDAMPKDGIVLDLEVTTEAHEVYVVANANEDTKVEPLLAAVDSKAKLKKVVGMGFDSTSSSANPTQTSSNLWMAGKNKDPLTIVEGEKATATVELAYIGAKVRITSVTVGAGIADKLKLSEVIVFNGANATHMIPTADVVATGKTSLIPTTTDFDPSTDSPFYMGGAIITGFTNKPTIVKKVNAYSYPLISDYKIEAGNPGKNQQYFYVFENDGKAYEAQPTIVTLKGVYTKSASEDVDTYYSVFFKLNTADEGYDGKEIVRGNSYDIELTINGVGSTDPTIPALKTSVDVTITAATWKTVTVEKTFD